MHPLTLFAAGPADLYQAYTTQLGALGYRCSSSMQYEFCTQELMEENDPPSWSLLSETPAGAPPMPQILPSGHYRPPSDELLLNDARWGCAGGRCEKKPRPKL